MRNNKIIIITSILTMIFFIAVGITYAYFSANITGGEETTTITVTGGTMNIIYNGGNLITANNITPKNEPFAIKIFTVTGNSTMDIDMGYNLSLVVTTNTFTDHSLKYKLKSFNTNNNGKVEPSSKELINITSGFKTITLGQGYFNVPTNGNKIHTYNLELYFPETNTNQNVDQGKSFKAHVEISNFDYSTKEYDSEKGVNKPQLFTGMTPVKWDESFNEIETTPDDPEWYDYNDKKWANAKTKDGSYWVWIPRYAYRITSNHHSSVTGSIDIKFLKGKTIINDTKTTIETTGYNYGTKDTSSHYFLHPAFVFNDEELGFWVAKYEASINNHSDPCYLTSTLDNCNKNTFVSSFVPNVTIWRNIQINNMFLAATNMKNREDIYGWEQNEVEPHLMKNSEWGAITYLSKSIYGANNEEVWRNSYDGYRTGCSSEVFDGPSLSTCVEFNTNNGIKASTTHNIYGVYDMSGGGYEYVSAYIDNGHSNIIENGKNILDAQNKYKNIYTADISNTELKNYEANKNMYGDAVYETSNIENKKSWNNDILVMLSDFDVFFRRGGYFYNDTADSGLFAFAGTKGGGDRFYSWRATIMQVDKV